MTDVQRTLSEDHVTPATLAEADERLRDAEVRIAALDKPTPEALERWAEWFDNPKNPCPVLNTMRYAPAKLTAGFLLREIARVMRDLAGEESLADELRMIEARASAELAGGG